MNLKRADHSVFLHLQWFLWGVAANIANHSRRYAGNNSEVWNIVSHNCARADKGMPADLNAAQDGGITAD